MGVTLLMTCSFPECDFGFLGDLLSRIEGRTTARPFFLNGCLVLGIGEPLPSPAVNHCLNWPRMPATPATIYEH
jgi:hypothetical protein